MTHMTNESVHASVSHASTGGPSIPAEVNAHIACQLPSFLPKKKHLLQCHSCDLLQLQRALQRLDQESLAPFDRRT